MCKMKSLVALLRPFGPFPIFHKNGTFLMIFKMIQNHFQPVFIINWMRLGTLSWTCFSNLIQMMIILLVFGNLIEMMIILFVNETPPK